MAGQQYTNVATKKRAGSEYEISATIPAEIVDAYRLKALKVLGKDVEVPGFRKGKVPEDMLIGHVGESLIMERAANMALGELYPQIVAEEKIDAIGSPHIKITKLARGNPLEFTATTAVMPEITLPDYDKIAKKIFSKKAQFEVEEKEVEETLMHIRRQRAQIDAYEKQKKDGVEQPQLPEVTDEHVPELTDEFVQTLGDFPTIDAFKAKVRENLREEKKLRDREKKRVETVEKIIADAKIELPNLLIAQELNRIQAQMEADIAQAGTKLEDYLKNISKTIEQLREEWRPEAEKRAKLQLILNAIAKEHGITPDKNEVQKEIEHVMQHYPHAQEENVRVYVETTKRNEMVFRHLEDAAK
jgi:FKBP-type peptidyl-prolyl cis-trans isomerase (trigger factor)